MSALRHLIGFAGVAAVLIYFVWATMHVTKAAKRDPWHDRMNGGWF
jgi:hypothetical protein